MIPNMPILTEQITETDIPSRTYKIAVSVAEPPGYDRMNGYTDDLDAVKQAVYLILSTERYRHIIYSWNYGIELLDLFGKQIPYAIATLPRRIKEALTQDDRIDDVVDFEFETEGKKIHTTFTVISNVGNLSAELEVEI